ncbi:MAG TPA: aspartate aminotransferase family protein [Dehalococcoidia bacterium]|jgi:2,2-dialkylglycine decarboxylase (pyruvate)|nr:aspartate aminotransferase family protein [Dehalococcoidia bacterium]
MTEQELLDIARDYCFRARVQKRQFIGPVLASGKGSIVVDVNGKEYIDFVAGQMCAALGHNHPRIVESIHRSCETMIHSNMTHFNVEEIKLAKRLGEVLPSPLKKSLFLLTGSDANEAAIVIAKKYTNGFEVASPHVSFHGMSDAARSITFGVWHAGYGPLLPGSYAIMAPYCYRCPVDHTFPECHYACLKAGFEILDAESVGALAAVITEPLFSAGGVIDPPSGWLKELKKMCQDRGMLLIVDEAQTGLAKLGSMFAFEQEGIVPDIVSISKHFGGELTISAVATSPEIEEVVAGREFVLGHSHAADPMACAAAIVSLDIIEDEGLVDKAKEMGKRIRDSLLEMAKRYEIIGDVRGRGVLQGIELVKDRDSKVPANEAGPEVERRCLEDGLLITVRGAQGRTNVLRLVVPFTTTQEQMDRAFDILESAIKSLSPTVVS